MVVKKALFFCGIEMFKVFKAPRSYKVEDTKRPKFNFFKSKYEKNTYGIYNS